MHTLSKSGIAINCGIRYLNELSMPEVQVCQDIHFVQRFCYTCAYQITGAHGVFESYGDFSNITAASFLGAAGKKTPVFVRFSTVAGSRGSADTARDVHGFATRFYTDEGNFGGSNKSMNQSIISNKARYCWKQYSSFLHSGCYSVPGSYPCCQAEPRQRNSTSCHGS